MNDTGKIGIGPMSIEIIDAIIDYANIKNKPVMLIASRNQIDCEELGGGYVGKLNTETFAKRVMDRDIGNMVQICRDHSGPYLNAAEKGLTYEDAMSKTLISLQADIDSGFDLLHIDTSACPDPYTAAEKMFKLALDAETQIEFEFGSEENVGIAASPEKFEQDVKFAKQFVTPRFVVGQTGTLVKSTFQVGQFSETAVTRLVEIANEYGVGLKEHNADYLSSATINHHFNLGVAACNIAPEFGVVQTRTITDLAIIHNCLAELDAFYKRVLAGGKYEKWAWTWFTDHYKYMSTGHYFFTSREYQFLIDALIAKGVNVDDKIRQEIFKLLDNYIP